MQVNHITSEIRISYSNKNWRQIRDKKSNCSLWFLSIRAFSLSLSLDWNLTGILLSAERMDMSSYQFVNTLAQCYEANAQLQGGAAPPPQDYYSMQYPNCYSPATQVHHYCHGRIFFQDIRENFSHKSLYLQGYAGQYSSMMGGAAPHTGGGEQYPPASSSTSASASRPR